MPRFLTISALLLIGSIARADDANWIQFRGPNRDGISPDKGLLKQWPADGPRLLWKATDIGKGYASVSIADGKVFTLGNKGSTAFIFAVDQATGKNLWSAELGKAGNWTGSTPTIDEGRLYAVGQDGDLVCARTSNGEVVWRKHFKKDFGGASGGWKFTESPLVDGEKLVCTPGGPDAGIVALNKKTGEVIWKAAIPVKDKRMKRAGYSSIVIAEVGGVKQYVQLMAAGVVGVRANDGKFLWIYDKLGRNTANIPNCIVLKDHLFCTAGYGKGGALLKMIPKGDTVVVEEVYYNRDLGNRHGGVVVVGDHVYGDRDNKGFPFCAEVNTGKLIWKKQDRSPGSGSAAMIYADGFLYIRYKNGVMALVPARPDGYKEVSTFKIPDCRAPSWAHPVVLDGKLYLREGENILCYDVKQQ